MTPFYFGAGPQRLFGIYEPAVLTGRGKRGAVLCYPWGPEYVHAHRVMRQLAIKLAGAGVHTLRFDFFGTGDWRARWWMPISLPGRLISSWRWRNCATFSAQRE